MSPDPDTTNPTPIEVAPDPRLACALPADGLAERIAWVRAEILPHAAASEPIESGLAWELDDAPGLAAKLDRLVALERQCCPGIVFAVTQSDVPGRHRLEIRGIDPRAAVFESLQVDPKEPPRSRA